LSLDRDVQICGVRRCARLAAAVNFNRPHGGSIRTAFRRRRGSEQRDHNRKRKAGGGCSGSQLHMTFTSDPLRNKLIRGDFIRRLYQLTIITIVTQDEWRKNKQNKMTRR